jgi:hypothetical protein
MYQKSLFQKIRPKKMKKIVLRQVYVINLII